jgi:hypothetical protein
MRRRATASTALRARSAPPFKLRSPARQVPPEI